MNIEIKKVKLSEIKLNLDNPRKIEKVKMDNLIRSLKEFPDMMGIREIVVDDTMTILGGNMRYQALKKTKARECIAKIVTGLTDKQKKEFIIKDNSSFGEYDWDLLFNNWSDFPLDDWGVNLPDDWMDMGKNIEGGLTDEDAVPEVSEEPITKIGDLWLIGDHRLLCGDSTDIKQVERLMGGQKADITFTSPPYNAGKSESLSGNTHTTNNKYINGHDDNMEGFDWLNLIQMSLLNATKYSSFQFINIQQLAGNKREVIEFLYNNKENFADVAIWNKQNTAPTIAKNVMNSQFEYVFIFSSENQPSRAISTGNFRGNFSNVYNGKPQRNNDFADQHAATFPVDFPIHYIEPFSSKHSIIYDPFCGTGTLIIAAEKTNRKGYGMEIDPHYCDIIIKRWEDYTGKTVKLQTVK